MLRKKASYKRKQEDSIYNKVKKYVKEYYALFMDAHLHRNNTHTQVIVTFRNRNRGMGPGRHSLEFAIHVTFYFLNWMLRS